MGREVRRVPPTWEHPHDGEKYIPLNGEYDDAEYPDAPCMPTWAKDEATHYMMYETCTEGTPISPAFATPEELAHWLADAGASAFGNQTATYEQWLSTIKRGWAPSAVMLPFIGIVSGVAGWSD